MTFVFMVLAAYWLFFLFGLSEFPPVAGPRDRFIAWVTRKHGDDWADGMSCPFCLGAWLSFAVVAVVAQYTVVELPALQALAVAGAVGIIGKVTA